MQHETQTLDRTPSVSLNRPHELTFTIDRCNHVARLAVSGEVDVSTQDSICRAAAAILQPPVRALLLDLDGVTFFGAAGVTALIAIRKAAARADIRLVLTGVRRQVRQVLDLTGTTGFPFAHARTTGPATADSPDMASAGCRDGPRPATRPSPSAASCLARRPTVRSWWASSTATRTRKRPWSTIEESGPPPWRRPRVVWIQRQGTG